jgi:DNA-binding MarR family transcriptional regulator
VSRLSRVIEHTLGPFELSLAQYRLLGLIVEGEAASSALADRIAVSPAGITGVVDALVNRKLVARGIDPTDGRRAPIRATAKGRKLWLAADDAIDRNLRSVASGGSDEVVDSLKRWHALLDVSLGFAPSRP